MNRERFHFFSAVLDESDLLLGVPHDSFHRGMMACVEEEMARLRKLLLDYSMEDSRFLDSLDPIDMPGTESVLADEIRAMISCGHKTRTGPMASVAGLFAEQVGKRLIAEYGISEVLVENGGDLFVRNESEILSVIHAGTSSLSDRMAFKIPEGEWGICTSSGTMGHSFSKGRADAVTVVMHSAPMADSWATALANRVTSAANMEEVLRSAAKIHDILACAVIVDEKIGIQGGLEVKMLTSDR